MKVIYRELHLKNKHQEFCQGRRSWTKANQLLGWRFAKELQSTNIPKGQTLTSKKDPRLPQSTHNNLGLLS